MAAASLGTVLSSTPLTLLVTGMGMKHSMLFLAAGCVIMFGVMFFVMKNEPADCRLLSQDLLEGNEIQQGKKFKNSSTGILLVLRQPRVWFVVAAVLVSNVGGVGAQWAATYLSLDVYKRQRYFLPGSARACLADAPKEHRKKRRTRGRSELPQCGKRSDLPV